MRQVTFYAISDLCTDTGRDNYPVARPDGRTDGHPHYYICEPVAADKNIKGPFNIYGQEGGDFGLRTLPKISAPYRVGKKYSYFGSKCVKIGFLRAF